MSEWTMYRESDRLNSATHKRLHQGSEYNCRNHSYSVPTNCNQTRPLLCPSPQASRERFSCISLDQIGDNHIDCAGAIDEHNTIEHCSHTSSMLGHNFRCLSTNTCIPYWLHCWGVQCPNRTDDEHWCSRPDLNLEDMTPLDVQCFDGESLRNARCDGDFDCQLGEDEYMCDRLSLLTLTSVPYRREKESRIRSAPNSLRLFRYPRDANITLLDHESTSSRTSREDVPYRSSTSSLSPYWCNRGIGILVSNDSIVCFCPPQYFGDKCQYQTVRLSVLLSLDFSQSIYQSDNDPAILPQVLVLFLFNNQTLMTHQFHLRPALELRSNQKNKEKMMAHFLYSQSSAFRQHRLERLSNRFNLIDIQPYSIRIEIYETRRFKPPSLIAVWQYPIHFDYLPVFRLAKVLHLTRSADRQNPCMSRPCRHDHEECHPLINDLSNYVCLCKPHFTGENCSEEDTRCLNWYCESGSLCMPNYRDDHFLPLCLCPSNRYGDQCSIEHDGCLLNQCLNNGSCYPAFQPDQVTCLCTKEFFGPKCERRRSHLRLSLKTGVSPAGAVLQYFDLDSTSLHIILAHQEAGRRLPSSIEFDNDQMTGPEIVLAKLYSSHNDSSPELYLLSFQQNVTSMDGKTEISEINRCPHVRTLTNGNLALCFEIHRD